VTIGLISIDARSSINEYIYCPLIRLLTDAEQGHKLGIIFLKYGIYPRLFNDLDDPILETRLFKGSDNELKLSNPIGIAAGFDKEGEVIDPLYDLGFGYVEIGSITPFPQPGNPKPRFFRLSKDEAVINRYGFNSNGHLSVLSTLRLRFEKLFNLNPNSKLNSFRDGKILGINLGKNKTGDEIEDYLKGVENFAPYADFLIINVSSPNTPNLRDLQASDKLTNLLTKVVNKKNSLGGNLLNPNKNPKIFVKIAPDLTEFEIESIAKSSIDSKIDGIILSNTTIQRPIDHLLTNDQQLINQTGGLSGKPLKEISLKSFKILRKYTKNSNLVLIGCGGISNGKDVIEFGKAGASFIQLYTSFAYKGPGLVRKIKDEVELELKKQGKTWMQIVGSDD
ncbi:hypothetical protein CANARDRAFT_186099, partial [[Candida] arabinofermentans NRRL YB-2248]